MSPRNAVIYVENIRRALVRLDPANAATYNANAAAYTAKFAPSTRPSAPSWRKSPRTTAGW
jgi:manganese/iron transport system substrate-binding protein